MKTIDKIITKVDCKYGSPMGRMNVGEKPKELLPDMSDIDTKDTYFFNVIWITRKKKLNRKQPKVFDCAVPLSEGYDRGGVYWGHGRQLRVSYTKDLTFIKFYRI